MQDNLNISYHENKKQIIIKITIINEIFKINNNTKTKEIFYLSFIESFKRLSKSMKLINNVQSFIVLLPRYFLHTVYLCIFFSFCFQPFFIFFNFIFCNFNNV